MIVTPNALRQLGFQKTGSGKYELHIHGYTFLMFPNDVLENAWRFSWGDSYEHLVTHVEELFPMIAEDMENDK